MRADATPAFLFAEPLSAVSEAVALEADMRHYLRVCRVREGDTVRVTDGRGTLASCACEGRARDMVLRVRSLERVAPPRPLWIACGAPEGQRADWLVEKLAELGVTRFQPVDFEQGAWRRGRGTADRWRRLAVSALRQSRRCHLMETPDPVTLDQLVTAIPEGFERVLAEARGGGTGPSGNAGWVGVVGPASGLEATERQAFAAAGFRAVRLSDATLRTETAALALASVVMAGTPGIPGG